MNLPKIHKSFAEQVEILKSRNMIIEDEKAVEEYLSKCNYYRLNVYFHIFLSKDKTRKSWTYNKKVSFEDIKAIEETDSYLRHLIFNYIEKIELKLRTLISYYSSKSFGEYAFDSGDCFDDQKQISIGNTRYSYKDLGIKIFADQLALMLQPFDQSVIQKMKSNPQNLRRSERHELLQLRKKYPVEYHHVLKYGGKFPAWVLVEYISFGNLSKVYRYLKKDIQNDICNNFNIFVSKGSQTKIKHFSSWLYCLSAVRNICAHHGYLFRRELDIKPSTKIDYFSIYLNYCNKKETSGYIFDTVICIYSILAKEERASFKKDFEDYINFFQGRKANKYKIELLSGHQKLPKFTEYFLLFFASFFVIFLVG